MMAPPGLYIHIPFCARRCPYCAFPISLNQDGVGSAYVKALRTEWEMRKNELEISPASLAFGGGTPSRMAERDLGNLLEGLAQDITDFDSMEISFEANPEDVTPSSSRAWKNLGINRVSLGIQSFDAESLKLLGREHGVEQAADSVHMIQDAGFEKVSLDLIAGTPGCRPEAVWESLDTALGFDLSHLSFYILEYEAGTRISSVSTEYRLTGDQEADILIKGVERITNQGYEWYEISNFSKPGARCVQNDNLWSGGDILGLGMGACSRQGLRRRRNTKNLSRYMACPTDPDEEELLSPGERFSEGLMLGLRTADGVSLSALETASGLKAGSKIREAVNDPSLEGLVYEEQGKVRATQNGRLVGDGLALALSRAILEDGKDGSLY